MKINKERKNLFSVEVLGLVLGIIWIAPFYLMIVNAFKTKREIFTGVLGLPKSLALENFVQAFNDLEFLKSLFNSLLITGVSVAIIILFSAMAGYALARNKSKLSGIIFFVFVAAMLIPFSICHDSSCVSFRPSRFAKCCGSHIHVPRFWMQSIDFLIPWGDDRDTEVT